MPVGGRDVGFAIGHGGGPAGWMLHESFEIRTSDQREAAAAAAKKLDESALVG